MAEIDTRPLESVQVALNLFEQRSDPSRFSSPDRNEQEIDVLARELAACRLQLEVKENENRQANQRLEAMDKAMQEMSERYDGACLEAYRRIAELETDVAAITGRQSQAASECEALRDELAASRGELDAVKRANSYVLGEVESMETRRILERESARDGLMRVLELNEAVLESAVAAMRAEEERSVFFQEATIELLSSGRDQEAVRRQKEAMEGMEGELLAKTAEVECLRSELKKLKDLYVSTEIAAKDQEPDVIQKETCLITESTRKHDQVDGKKTGDVMEDKVGAEGCTVPEWQADSEVTDTYFDSELPEDLNAQYDADDVVDESINGSMPEQTVEGQEEPEIGDRFVAETPIEKFRSVHKQYCTDMSPGTGMPESSTGKRVRFLDESFEHMNSDVRNCKDMDAGIGLPEKLAAKRRPELEAGGGFVNEIVEVDAKVGDGDGDFFTKEVVDTGKLGDGYVLVAKKNAGTHGKVALRDENLHAEISDLRFSLEEAVRRAELAEEGKAALERELKEEINWKQRRQPRPTEDVPRKRNVPAPRPPPPAPSPPARRPQTGPSHDPRIPVKGCLTLGMVLNMKYK